MNASQAGSSGTRSPSASTPHSRPPSCSSSSPSSILAAFSKSQNALFTLFGAATLLPAVIYAAVVVLYLIKRKELPANGKFDLGGWEKPILIVAVVWLVFELALFRDASFKNAWLYVLVMIVLGAIYLGVLLARRGLHGLAMPEMISIDATLDHVAEQDTA